MTFEDRGCMGARKPSNGRFSAAEVCKRTQVRYKPARCLSAKGSRAYPRVDTPPAPGATELLSSFRYKTTKMRPQPEMPPYFGDVEYMHDTTRTLLWRLIMDMIYAPLALTNGMNDILGRLESMFMLDL